MPATYQQPDELQTESPAAAFAPGAGQDYETEPDADQTWNVVLVMLVLAIAADVWLGKDRL
jgi:hypothetical protein